MNLDNETDVIVCRDVQPSEVSGMRPVDVNKGIMLRHEGTGIVAFCDTERSQKRNLAVARHMIRAALSYIRDGACI